MIWLTSMRLCNGTKLSFTVCVLGQILESQSDLPFFTSLPNFSQTSSFDKSAMYYCNILLTKQSKKLMVFKLEFVEDCERVWHHFRFWSGNYWFKACHWNGSNAALSITDKLQEGSHGAENKQYLCINIHM